jgi:REP element-mobilizing transposase RayT
MSERQDNSTAVGRVPSRGAPVPTPGAPVPAPDESPPRRLRRLLRVWPDREGHISYFLTICVDGRARVLDNEQTCQRFMSFLLDSPTRYGWFGRRFVIMPDHIHLIADMGQDAVRLGQRIKALKAVVCGLERRESPAAAPVGRVPSGGVPGTAREFTRTERAWHWQAGFHDHKFRTPESESRKWEYVCLNPVRSGLVKRPEEWPFGGEIFYDDAGGPRLARGTPPALLETGMLLEEEKPREGTRPTI